MLAVILESTPRIMLWQQQQGSGYKANLRDWCRHCDSPTLLPSENHRSAYGVLYELFSNIRYRQCIYAFKGAMYSFRLLGPRKTVKAFHYAWPRNSIYSICTVKRVHSDSGVTNGAGPPPLLASLECCSAPSSWSCKITGELWAHTRTA